MSSLLEQAIIDAKLIKEAAKKNAEAAILEHYAEEIKANMEALLEADEPGADAGIGAPAGGADPLAAAPAMGAAPAPNPIADAAPKPLTGKAKSFVDSVPASYLGEDNSQEIEINLETLVQEVNKLNVQPVKRVPDETKMEGEEQEEALAESFELDESALEEEVAVDPSKAARMDAAEKDAAKLRAQAFIKDREKTDLKVAADAEARKKEEEEATKAKAVAGAMEEDIELSEEQLEEIMHVDMENVGAGGINMNEIEIQKELDVYKAKLAQLKNKRKELEEALVAIGGRYEETEAQLAKVSKNNETLAQTNQKLAEGVEFLKQKLNEMGIMNSQLLYTNKILRNSSLNERQKESIVESISKAKSVNEAKTIYETLQSSTASVITERKAPQSLTEALNKAPHPFITRNNQSPADINSIRWQRLAGIKK